MINEIKQKLTCTDYLASRGVSVRDGGRCISPLRSDARNPTSFYVKGDFWYDFSASSGGDVIDLCAAMECDGDNRQAIRVLAQRLNLEYHTSAEEQKYREDIQALCSRTAAYHAALTEDDYLYLSERGVTRDDAERLMIGRVTDGALKGRLFLPYFKNGAVVYYATRAMPGGTYPDNKYMKGKLTDDTSYQHIPWGWQTLSRKTDTLIISEGYFDALAWETNGYAVLSPITGNFSSAQWADVISACRMFDRVLIIFDNDDISHAGDGFTQRTAEKLYKNGIRFVVGHTPKGVKDVNDYYVAGGDLRELVRASVNGISYLIQHTENFIDNNKRYISREALSDAIEALPEEYDRRKKSMHKMAETAPSESVIADEIIRERDLVYVDNVGFYEWNGKIWKTITDSEVKQIADLQYGKPFTSAQRIAAVCNLLKARCVTRAVFDRAPVLTFQNGTLEVETGVFRGFSKNDNCSIIMNYDYDPSADCPVWRKFITDVTDEDPQREDILQTFAGYVLFPDCRLQKIIVLIGSGGNGKSVYLEIIQKIFGYENVTHVEPSGLKDSFQRIKLKDSLLNVSTDINSNLTNDEIREWLIKISDGTSVQACYKGLNNVDFIPRTKLIYACNEIPSAEVTKGLNRRLHFVDFQCRFVEHPDPADPKQKPRDIDIVDKMTAELPGIFNWVYEGYIILRQAGYFTEATEQAELMNSFETTSNPVQVFCDDYIFTGSVQRNDLYYKYRCWCEDTGHKALSRERFFPKFRDIMERQIVDERRISTSDGKRERVFVFRDAE